MSPKQPQWRKFPTILDPHTSTSACRALFERQSPIVSCWGRSCGDYVREMGTWNGDWTTVSSSCRSLKETPCCNTTTGETWRREILPGQPATASRSRWSREISAKIDNRTIKRVELAKITHKPSPFGPLYAESHESRIRNNKNRVLQDLLNLDLYTMLRISVIMPTEAKFRFSAGGRIFR